MPPARLPVLPLRDLVFFPQHVMPLLVGRQASLAALEAATATPDKLLLLVAQRDGEEAEPSAAGLHRVGVVARVLQITPLPNGVAKVLLEGVTRARVTRFTPAGPLLRATVTPAPLVAADAAPPSPADAATARRAVALFEEYAALHRRVPAEVVQLVVGLDLPERQAYTIAAHLAVRQAQRQALLESADLVAMFTALADVLQGEIELLRLERKIEEEVRGTLFKHQREYFLQEQLRAIHRELGQEEDESAELEAQIAARGLPPAAEARARRELRRLRKLSPMSPEAGVARSYLEWLLALPWHEREEAAADLGVARAVLDEQHYGLEQVKERILDYVAVLGNQARGGGPLPLLCLVGPPGVGKTSLGRSIALAVGRRFARMSLGGMRDEAEIRGHRRTYVGAMPGRILQAMRRVEVVNPVLLLDEIDKLGQDYRGDPAAALLEVLDPEQQHAFSDHYLELEYDLSQVLFLTTANSLAGIPAPLRDRMEIIRLPGYLDQEKRAIAERHLLPRQLERHGFGRADVTLEADALGAVLRGYTREAGVRELDRRLARLVRKLARRRAEEAGAAAAAGAPAPEGPPAGDAAAGPAATIVVRLEEIRALLGPAPFDGDQTTLDDKVGVAAGLAYTPAGGEVLEIEVSAVPGRGRLQLTGTLGDVMKESAGAALSFARARADALGLPADFHRTRDLHLHIPAGATPKDGPSAGVAITTAIVSALTGIPVRGDVAMTGEITLRGRVLPIGGLREKAVAALRNGITQVVIPAGNVRQLEELPDEVRAQLTFHAVETLDAALALALRDVPAPVAVEPPQRTPARATGTAAAAAPPPAPQDDA